MQRCEDTQPALQTPAGLAGAEGPPGCSAQQSSTSRTEQGSHPSPQPHSLTAAPSSSQSMMVCHGHVPWALNISQTIWEKKKPKLRIIYSV